MGFGERKISSGVSHDLGFIYIFIPHLHALSSYQSPSRNFPLTGSRLLPGNMWSLISLCLIPLTAAAPQRRTLSPTVDLDYAKVIGSSSLGIDVSNSSEYLFVHLDNSGDFNILFWNLGSSEITNTPRASKFLFNQTMLIPRTCSRLKGFLMHSHRLKRKSVV